MFPNRAHGYRSELILHVALDREVCLRSRLQCKIQRLFAMALCVLIRLPQEVYGVLQRMARHMQVRSEQEMQQSLVLVFTQRWEGKGLYMKRRLTLLIGYGFPFGILTAAIRMKYDPVPFRDALATALIEGLIFGTIMALSTVYSNDLAIRRKYRNALQNAYSVCQQRCLLLRMPYDQLFDICLAVVGMCSGGKIFHEDRNTGSIIIRGRADVIHIQIEPYEGEEAKVHVSSRPRLQPTVIDGGRNYEAVEKIVIYLQQAQHDRASLLLRASDSSEDDRRMGLRATSDMTAIERLSSNT